MRGQGAVCAGEDDTPVEREGFVPGALAVVGGECIFCDPEDGEDNLTGG